MELSVPVQSKNEFINNIQIWVQLDSNLKKINEKSKELREYKNTVTANICEFIETNHLEETKIEITGGEIKYVDKKDYPPLTFDYIETTLGKIIKDKSNVDYIIKALKDNRKITTHKELKRVGSRE